MQAEPTVTDTSNGQTGGARNAAYDPQQFEDQPADHRL